MIAAAVIWLVSLVGIFVGARASPDHTIRGLPALALFAANWGAGIALSIHAL